MNLHCLQRRIYLGSAGQGLILRKEMVNTTKYFIRQHKGTQNQTGKAYTCKGPTAKAEDGKLKMIRELVKNIFMTHVFPCFLEESNFFDQVKQLQSLEMKGFLKTLILHMSATKCWSIFRITQPRP